jgi:hypothetical protein
VEDNADSRPGGSFDPSWPNEPRMREFQRDVELAGQAKGRRTERTEGSATRVEEE